MAYTTIISTEELALHLDDPDWVVIDCRFRLDDVQYGRTAYLDSHIPGALYAHLDEDLSGPVVTGQSGRHPLPAVDTLAAKLSRWGIDQDVQVVVYDDQGGVYAGRLWWMLKWLGHEPVAVLDGDWRQWIKEVRPTISGEDTRQPRTFVPHENLGLVVSVDEVLANLENDEFVLVDARDTARYRGEVAGLDPIAGHIPGARSAHYGNNLADNGKFKAAEELLTYYAELLADPDAGVVPEDIVFYCGSGVSAAHDLLAMEIAGLGRHRLYVGSWSDWINDPSRPIATTDLA